MFVTNASADRTMSGVLSCSISDHIPIFIFVDKHDPGRRVRPNKATYREISPTTLQTFRDSIQKINWTKTFAIQESKLCYEAFMSIFKAQYLKSFPMRACKQRKHAKRGSPHILLSKVKTRTGFTYYFSNNGSHQPGQNLKLFETNWIEKQKRQRKTTIIAFPTELKEVLNRKTRAARLQQIVADCEILTKKELPDKFSNYFTELGGYLNTRNTDIFEYVPETASSIFLLPTDVSEATVIFQSYK